MTQPRHPAARPPGRPRSAEAEEAILAAALRHLAEHGYARMSMDAIAADAGTTKPTIYRRWPGKEELAVAALARLQTEDEPTPTGDTAADLATLLRDFQKKLLRPNGLAMIGTILAEERHTPRLTELFREKIVTPRRQGLLKILAAAEARGDVRRGTDLEAAVNLLVGSFYARYLTGDGIPPDWPERIVGLVLRALQTGD